VDPSLAALFLHKSFKKYRIKRIIAAKMLQKSQVFYFFLSFSITFITGFFLWNIFILNNNIFDTKFFKAALSSAPEADVLNLTEGVQTEEQVTSPKDEANFSPVVVLTEAQKQEILDDIQEKLDIISQQVQELIDQQDPPEEEKELDKEDTEDQNNQNTSGGGNQIIYPKILISEVLIKPINQRFIELYNPNSVNINLTDWYLQRKDSNDEDWGSLVSSTYFEGKIIGSNDYFLISRELTNSDILYDITLSDSNSLALKNPNREISDQINWSEVADNTSWCFDFGTCFPTPRAKNTIPPVVKNILINEVQISPTNQRFIELYNPNNYNVDLTGYYLQRKDDNDQSWGSLVSSTYFAGKTILANSYFLISRELSGSDILYGITLSADNSLALKNSNRDIVDKVGWGQALDPEGTSAPNPTSAESISRQLGIDTDNNNQDFIILSVPTPKAR